MDADSKKTFKIKDVNRKLKKSITACSLEEIQIKAADKFGKNDQLPTIHLDSDGTEIDDEEYFRTLESNTELIAVFPGEHWTDATHYVTISSHRDYNDTTDATDETNRIKKLVGQLQNNLCNVSVMSDPDLDLLSNMDPNSLVDITGKDFMEQLKDSGRPLYAKRTAEDRINLLRLLKDGAIFCSERYPEDAEDIDLEINNPQSTFTPITKAKTTTTTTTTTNSAVTTTTAETTTKTTTTTTTAAAITTPTTLATTIQEIQKDSQSTKVMAIVAGSTTVASDSNATRNDI